MSQYAKLITFRTTEKMFWMFEDLCRRSQVTQSEMLRTMVDLHLEQEKEIVDAGS